ncbi:hypothetical protein S245_007134, partial [Arachis hypogaea]
PESQASPAFLSPPSAILLPSHCHARPLLPLPSLTLTVSPQNHRLLTSEAESSSQPEHRRLQSGLNRSFQSGLRRRLQQDLGRSSSPLQQHLCRSSLQLVHQPLRHSPLFLPDFLDVLSSKNKL